MTEQKRVVFVTGDHEYGGEETMPLLAAELQRNYGLEAVHRPSMPDQNAEENIPGLEALEGADLAVFYLRWRRLPPEQLRHIERYVQAGKPVIGLRTTSHSFKYPEGHALESWNAWAAETFGAPPGWGNGHTHYGHQASTDVSIVEDATEHPILAGIKSAFHVRSWLYHVLPDWPPADATRLLSGRAVEPNKPAIDNPVAWIWRNKHGGRAFFTTLGHPEDFQVQSMQQVMINAVHWCLGLDVPHPFPGAFKMDVPYCGIRE